MHAPLPSPLLRRLIGTAIVLTVGAFGLSRLGCIPYIYTVCSTVALLALYNLLMLGDDASGGWNNPHEEKQIWRESLLHLAAKVLVLIALLLVAIYMPWISALGSCVTAA